VKNSIVFVRKDNLNGRFVNKIEKTRGFGTVASMRGGDVVAE